ncbi:curli production assembly/transport component CsgG [Sphingobacterium spiritivorum ATCC 33300]|uniref:Curli production assembly/transport component CsgG n=2 Tax=Sphingobacterium spiritivorum TaxID=258 RepID=C2G2J0_SPHSI|nr:curli production assembly/transport component CsgG [Sphingobacterium spiritivorum ATCC 33300]QQS95470.1 curli production assembly protein CsgG [Sphingobacterium spiritivorum]
MYVKCNNIRSLYFFPILLLFISGCSALIKAPTRQEPSTFGEATPYTRMLRTLPVPREKTIVAVYKFKDQTGQYKASENISNWSTAIPQGTTSILLKALEDSKWFTTIERENISDLLNERQIIKSTRQEYANLQNQNAATSAILPPLLFAGVIIEGGIISYDFNLVTGGVGARYFGIGGSTQYRQDRISVYLRAVSTNNGMILKTVYTSKTILSQSVNGSFFRYVDPERLLEAEIGFTKNEPVHLAVKEAIEKAVYSLVMEGYKENLWRVNDQQKIEFNNLLESYMKEKEVHDNLRIDGRILNPKRGNLGFYLGAIGHTLKGDYKNSRTGIGPQAGIRLFINDRFSLGIAHSVFYLENKDIFKKKFNSTDLNMEYIFMPEDNLSPYIYSGIVLTGLSSRYLSPVYPFFNIGSGIEYLPHSNFGIRGFGGYDFGFKDNMDGYVGGKRKDNIFRFGIGIQYYFDTKTKKK